jgi:hypothetical protein
MRMKTSFFKRLFRPRSYIRKRDQLLSAIEQQRGKTNKKFFKLSEEYAVDVLGNKKHSPWLCLYSAVAGEFKEGWIPEDYYGRVVEPATKGSYRRLADLSLLTGRLFQSEAFPDIAYFVNGLFYGKGSEILSADQLQESLFSHGAKVVFKLDGTCQGKGIFFFDKDSFEVNANLLPANGVFQRYIDQHEFFDQFTSNSVATLRMTTVFDGHEFSLRGCYLRLGRDQDTHVKSESQVKVPVDIVTGELGSVGYASNWTPITEHPDSGVIFSQQIIPDFDRCLSLVIDLHASIPYLGCLGWDIVVDRSNAVKVMEWNSDQNTIQFEEATQGPCFADLGWEKLWRRSN